MKKIIIQQIIIISIIAHFNQAFAQQTSLNTLYNQNGYLINPAYAGFNDCFSAFINNRNQWVGIKDRPIRNIVTVDGRVANRHGLGGSVSLYQLGLLRNINAKFAYAYHLQVGADSRLSFGVGLGLQQQSFSFSDAIATDYSDFLIAGGDFSGLAFSSNAGLIFSTSQFQLGISLPQLFSNRLIFQNGTDADYDFAKHITVHAKYDLFSIKHWLFTPSVLYRNALTTGHQVDLGIRAGWQSTLGLGIMYRSSYGAMGIIDLTLKEKFKLAYSYGFGGRSLTGTSSGTHEVMLGIKLCKQKVNDVVENMPNPDRNQPKTEVVNEDIVQNKVEIKETEVSEEVVEVKEEKENQPEEIQPIIKEVPKVIEVKEVETDDQVQVSKPIDLDSLNRVYKQVGYVMTYVLNSKYAVNSSNFESTTTSIATVMRQNPDLKIMITGHTCHLGSIKVNQEIGLGRAGHAKQKLIKLGIAHNRISITSKGASQPAFSNISEENRMKNRRVEIRFSR